MIKKEKFLFGIYRPVSPIVSPQKHGHSHFLGPFPYKGYFSELERAKLEQAELQKQNYDTRIRSVGGWSTLGWFSDPILSNMLDRSEGRFGRSDHSRAHSFHTILLRMTLNSMKTLHRSLVNRGAVMFLESKYGKGSV